MERPERGVTAITWGVTKNNPPENLKIFHLLRNVTGKDRGD